MVVSIPEHGLVLTVRLDSHFDSNHCGCSEINVAKWSPAFPDAIKEISAEIRPLIGRNIDLNIAVVSFLEFGDEIAVSRQRNASADAARSVRVGS